MTASRRGESPAIWRPFGPDWGWAFAEEMNGLSSRKFAAIVEGRRLKAPLPRVTYGGFTAGPLSDPLAEPGGLLVVSSRLQEVLDREAKAHIQYIPVKLKGRSGRYSIANVLDSVDCLDRGASRLIEDPDAGGITRVKKLVLTELPGASPELFHVEGFEQLLIIRPRLRAALERDFPSAGNFIPIARFKLGYLP